jgi:hypothetical protein
MAMLEAAVVLVQPHQMWLLLVQEMAALEPHQVLVVHQ